MDCAREPIESRMFESNFGSARMGSGRKFVNYGNGGTITRRTDLCAATGCMTYGSGAGPHALTGITGTVNGFVNPTFTYDANGNMTAGLGRTMTWTTFNMPLTIAQGTTLGYLYDAEHNRYKQCVGGCTSPTSTTLYLNGPGSEEKVTTGSTVTWRDYIAAAGQIVAERFNTSGTITTRYFVADHLGSTAVLTDETGAVVERDFYDAWGKQVTSTGAADTTCSLPPASQTTRGFTTQEHVDPVCLENFNARMYDPQLGRFMSADSINPDPLNGQAFDRYAYTYNNLLNATDPSGHASGEAQDGGMPCWGCSGPEMDDGLPVGMGNYTITANGGSKGCNSDACLQSTLTSLAAANIADGGSGITVAYNPGLLSGFSFGIAAASGNAAGDQPVADPSSTSGAIGTTGAPSYVDTTPNSTGDFNGPVENVTIYGPSGYFIPAQYEAPSANPPGTDWDYQEGLEGWDSLGAGASIAQVWAAQVRQARVQAEFQALKNSGMPVTQTDTVSNPDEGPSYAFENGIIFSDRNDDMQMDEAMYYDKSSNTEYVNYGASTYFELGWQVYNSSTVMSAPPPPGKGPDTGF
jgi:RHS repeat-associated protein